MSEFSDNKPVYEKAKRGTYIIFSLRYDKTLDLVNLNIDRAEEAEFASDDLSSVLIAKCKKANGFVRKFILNNRIRQISFQDGTNIPIKETYLFNIAAVEKRFRLLRVCH